VPLLVVERPDDAQPVAIASNSAIDNARRKLEGMAMAGAIEVHWLD
jgi:hypothetical protein